MPTFIYAPGVKVYIDTDKHGLVDVSEDLSEGTMVRRSDGVSTFNFTLNNPRRKYDSVFAPNDRIVCVMKRLAWVRTFTGLLNSVPLITVWPRDVPLAASCSLKRLQYWFWDPHSAETYNMILLAMGMADNGTKGNSDGGITNIVVQILEKVVGWPQSKVHIAQIPRDWYDTIALKIAQQVDKEVEAAVALGDAFQASLGGGYVAGANTGVAVNGKLTEGQYGGVRLNSSQLRIVETIYTAGKGMGLDKRDIVCGLMCAYQESRFRTGPEVYHKDHDSVGPFQQRPSMGWGTEAQCQDVTYSAKKFFTELKKVGNRSQMSEGQAVQTVQRSAFPNAYQQWLKMAEYTVSVLEGFVASGGSYGTNPALNPVLTTSAAGSSGISTGLAMAQIGVDLVERYPRIPYSQHVGDGIALAGKKPPPGLDCGTFVQWCYFNTVGKSNNIPRTVRAITSWVTSNGGRRVSVAEAAANAGALLCKTAKHVEVSLGDSGSTVGAHSTSKPAGMRHHGSVAGLSQYFDYGLLMPGLTYSGGTVVYTGGGTTTGGDAASAAIANPLHGSDMPGFNPNDKFDSLFGNNSWVPTGGEADPEQILSGGLSGVMALLNDEPLLAYIKNLFNSSMRSFCSAPNGDLIAWFPDYYGLWGTAAKMVLQPIEVQDFTVEWSDDFFVTHQFTMAGMPGATVLDLASGSIADPGYPEGNDEGNYRIFTNGVANIDIPAMMSALFGIEATKQEANNFAAYIYKRFGARPSFQPMPGLQGPRAEFFSAVFMFMRQWAYQYNADVPLTFMPELFPGMLIQIPAFDFQAYVTTVTHTFRFGPNGGFSTTVNIAAPARMPKKGKGNDHVLVGLPLAGDYKPGRGVGNTQPNPTDSLPTGMSEHSVR